MAEQQLLAGEPVGGANKSLLLRRTSGEIIASFGGEEGGLAGSWKQGKNGGGGINEQALLSCSLPPPMLHLDRLARCKERDERAAKWDQSSLCPPSTTISAFDCMNGNPQ